MTKSPCSCLSGHKRRLATVAIGITSATLLLAGCGGSTDTRRRDREWANAVCTSLLARNKQIHHDETSLDLGAQPSGTV